MPASPFDRLRLRLPASSPSQAIVLTIAVYPISDLLSPASCARAKRSIVTKPGELWDNRMYNRSVDFTIVEMQRFVLVAVMATEQLQKT